MKDALDGKYGLYPSSLKETEALHLLFVVSFWAGPSFLVLIFLRPSCISQAKSELTL